MVWNRPDLLRTKLKTSSRDIITSEIISHELQSAPTALFNDWSNVNFYVKCEKPSVNSKLTPEKSEYASPGHSTPDGCTLL